MRLRFIILVASMGSILGTALPCFAITNIYFQNNTKTEFSISSQQTGTHTLDPSEWGALNDTISPWQVTEKVLWSNRDQGIHNGDFFYFDTWLVSGTDTVTLQLKLEGTFVGSDMWQSAKGPGFNHPWFQDNNYHQETFQMGGKTYTLKYIAYFTGTWDDVLYAIQEHEPWPVAPTGADTLDIMSYNLFMLSQGLSFSDQEERAAILPNHLKDYDVLILSEAFDNTARDSILIPGLTQYYPYRTDVVNTPQAPEDGGVLIMSKWPILASQDVIFNDCDGNDCLSSKGVMYARIDKMNRIYHVLGTHTQAWVTSAAIAARQNQLREIRGFIDALNIPATQPVLVGGDLNVDRIGNLQNEYDSMLTILSTSPPEYVGHPYTYDPDYNLYASGTAKEYLDYVMHLNDHLLPADSTNEVIILRDIHDDVWDDFDLSDHFGVHGHFTFPSTVTAIEPEIVEGILLFPNYPNPFSDKTTFRFDLPVSGEVRMNIFDRMGKSIAQPFNQYFPSGMNEVEWSTEELPSGIYIAIFESGIEMKKLIILKGNQP